MNFGLVCDDPAAAPLLAALQQHPLHALKLAVLVSPRVDALLAGLSGVKCVNRWEELLTADDLDAVIIGGAAAEIWIGARQLASAGIPLLLFPNFSIEETVLYELSLIRDDQHAILAPAWTHRFDPGIQQLLADWKTADRPQISYVEWERGLSQQTEPALTNQMIDEALSGDADLLRLLCGEVDQVTSLRLGESDRGAAMQTVKLVGRNFPETTWSIKPSPVFSSRITFQTGSGALRLEWDATRRLWTGDVPSVVSTKSPETQLLDEFANKVAGKIDDAGWNNLLKSMEIVDAARRSLIRRRTIDLHHELLSERAIFKTQMAAMGCGVLVLTLALMLGYLAFASLVPLSGWMLKFLRILIFAPLFIFLLLQLLLPLTRPAK